LVLSGVVDAADLPADWFVPLPPLMRVVRVTEPVVADSLDFRFSAAYTGLEILRDSGSVIAWSNGKPVITPYPDCMLVMPSLRQLRAGVTVVRLGRIEREVPARPDPILHSSTPACIRCCQEMVRSPAVPSAPVAPHQYNTHAIIRDTTLSIYRKPGRADTHRQARVSLRKMICIDSTLWWRTIRCCPPRRSLSGAKYDIACDPSRVGLTPVHA
jgi:hypothetical protein